MVSSTVDGAPADTAAADETLLPSPVRKDRLPQPDMLHASIRHAPVLGAKITGIANETHIASRLWNVSDRLAGVSFGDNPWYARPGSRVA